MGKDTRNPRTEAIAALEKAADAALLKRLRALRPGPAKGKDAQDDFTTADLEALAASLEE